MHYWNDPAIRPYSHRQRCLLLPLTNILKADFSNTFVVKTKRKKKKGVMHVWDLAAVGVCLHSLYVHVTLKFSWRILERSPKQQKSELVNQSNSVESCFGDLLATSGVCLAL